MASSQDASQTTTANAQHGANCCGFCSVGLGGAVVVDPPPLICCRPAAPIPAYHMAGSWWSYAAGTRRLARTGASATRHFLTTQLLPSGLCARGGRACWFTEQAGPRAGVRNIHVSSCITRRARAQLAAGIGRRFCIAVWRRSADPSACALPPVTVTAPEQQRAASARPPRNAARSARTVRQARALGAADRWRSAGYRGGALAVLSAQQALTEINNTPGGVAVVPAAAYRNSTVANTIKDILDYVARRLRAAEMGRRHKAIDPRFRPVAQFPSARRPLYMTAFRSTPPTATAISRRSTRPPTNMSRSGRAPTRCSSARTCSAAPSIS